MALMEIDQVAVDSALWDKAKAGDEGAREALRDAVDNQLIYLHAMPVLESETVVTLRQLDEVNILGSVTLSVNPMI